jgi:hypothetical protein
MIAMDKELPPQVEAAINKVRRNEIDETLRLMNEDFAVVRIGGKTRVMALEGDPARRGALIPTYSTFADFKAFHDKYRVEIEVEDDKGNRKMKRIGKGTWWIANEERRQYRAVVFEPNATDNPEHFNLWRGFAVNPEPGNCSLYLDHIRNIICSGNHEYADYLLDYMAFGVQHPGEQAGIAVVLKGGEGTGKGMLVNIYGTLFGPHYVHVNQPGHLTGHFNAHLQLCRVLFADEALFAGDPRHSGPLKALITEDTMPIEPKGLDPFLVRNCLMIFMASNEAWVVPAGADARRYFVLSVSEAKKQNLTYFKAIVRQMDKLGRSALLHYLLNRDISGFDIRKVPMTEALAEQKAHSRKGIDALVELLAAEGSLPVAKGDAHHVAITSGEAKGLGFYAAARKLVPDLKRMTSRVIAQTLVKEWGCSHWRSHGANGIAFPALADLRARFDAKHGHQEWSDSEQDWTICDLQQENP